jgi:inner membrane protein
MLIAMDPITHFMTGACLGRAGFNRKAAYATLAMTLAAEAPDLDVLWLFKGPVAAFEHHRGWTHALIGLPLEAGVVVGFVWLIHRWRMGRRKAADHQSHSADRQAAPVRWG